MKVVFNKNILLWAIGVLQPASASDTLHFISYIFPEITPLPSAREIEQIISQFRVKGHVARVHGKSRLYSLTSAGNKSIPVKLRRHRDKARLFLIKNARKNRIQVSGEEIKNLVGDSPTSDSSIVIQEVPRAAKTTASPRYPRLSGPFYWPRVSKQLENQVGLFISSPDTFHAYYSFPSVKLIHSISDNPAVGNDLSITDLSLAIGISARLMTSLLHATDKYYRQFKIGKRGGGERVISSPRTYLKTVQYWLLDYLLCDLKIHHICHSYQKGKSIITNASPHQNAKFVANVDIKDFFGSIRPEMIRRLLEENGIEAQLSRTISRLCSYKNGLPQGAPTSPVISNAYLYHFDVIVERICRDYNLNITRYADDITISGENRTVIRSIISRISKLLASQGLALNQKKTRIAGQNGQQKVTGIVVNQKLLPPKSMRKSIRAMFHQADRSPEQFLGKLNTLRGYYNYLNSFDDLKNGPTLNSYSQVLSKLKAFRAS